MPKFCLIGFLSVLSFCYYLDAQAQPVSSSIFRNTKEDVVSQYASISHLDVEQRKSIYISLTPEMQNDLWLLHTQLWLEDHPDISDEQRDVVFQALGILATGGKKSPQLQGAIGRLQQRARDVFPPELLRSAFLELGATVSREPNRLGGLRVTPLAYDCECSTADDWCAILPTNPLKCFRGRGICAFTQDGCGWWLDKGCNGVCL